MGVTASVGAFSGINYADLISGLLEVEKNKVTKLENRKGDYETQISAYGELSSSLQDMRSSLSGLKTTSMTSYSATSSDTKVLTASATTSASEGNYQINVSQIATGHQIYSQAFSSDSVEFNRGTLNIDVGGEVTSVAITGSNNKSLTSISNSINSSGAGVTSSVIKDNDGYRLVLSTKSTGASNVIGSISLTGQSGSEQDLSAFTYDAEFSDTGSMQTSSYAQDAEFTINGLSVTSSTNSISNVISGVNLNLRDDSDGSDITLSIERDSSNMSEKIETFISSYNSTITKLKELTSHDLNGSLSTDSSVNSIARTLRGITTSTHNNDMLVNLGISHDRFGLLQLSSSNISAVINSDLNRVVSTMNTFAGSFETTVNSVIRSIIPNRTSALKQRIRRVEDNVFNEEDRLSRLEESLVKKFANLETTIAQLQSTGDSVSSSLSNISKQFGGK